MNQARTSSTPTTGDHVEACIFCQVNDESLNKLVDETTHFYARQDNFPAARGHVQIVPKRHIVSLFEISPEEMAEAYKLLRRVQAKLEAELSPDGYTVGVNEGKAAGRTVDHLHIHLIPRYEGDVDDPRGGIRQIFPDCDPDAWASAD